MERQAVLQEVSREIERLAEFHILYRMENYPLFDEQKEKIRKLIHQHNIRIQEELEPISRNLYRRYFA